MKFKRLIAAVLIITSVLLSAPVSAVGSPAYDQLSAEAPVYVRELTLSELEEYYAEASTDEILDPDRCNYTYGEVSVGGVAEFCHVYMRTFIITDVKKVSVYDLELLAKRIVSFVKDSSSEKYLKCIARTYNARISGVAAATGSVTVKIFIACGEKTEDRQALVSGYIADIAKELRPLSHGERFLRMNELMLDGRFRYDISYKHRCSSVALVEEGLGVCEEYAGFTSLLLDSLGYKNSIITGEVGGIPHMWNLVTFGGRTYHLDILHNGPINGEGAHTSVNRTFLLVSEKTVTSTHTVADRYADSSSRAEYDYVFDGYPKELPVIAERDGIKYIEAESSGMTAGELAGQYGAEGFLRVLKNGEILKNDDTVSTGCTVQIYVNGAIESFYVLTVKGDLSGNGVPDEPDIGIVMNYLTSDGKTSYGLLFRLAADLDDSGDVTVKDLVILADAAAGLYPAPEPGGAVTEVTAG